MKIKNINGTADNDCSCGSWLEHWSKFSRYKAGFCCVPGCENKDIVGAHVQKDDVQDRSWYIVPLCKAHNKAAKELQIFDDTPLVSANKAETCEKPKSNGLLEAYRKAVEQQTNRWR